MPSDAIFGKYRIQERIASGGMAEIFKARLDGPGGFQRTFAIKRILPHLSSNPEFVDLLVDEAKVAGLLSHANIVQIMDLGQVDEHYFIAMEYIDGCDLGKVLERCREKGITLPVPHAVFICIELLKGLEYAHARRIMKDGRAVPLNMVHRDISPPNILISRQGEVKITDFGIAKASVKALETVAGVVKGHFDYLSPEQSQGAGLDHRSDLFSLGMVFYEMLVGIHPFRKENELASVEAIRAGAHEPPSHVNMDVPPQLDDIVAKALAVDPDERHSDATAFKRALADFFHESEFIFTQSTLAAFMKGLFPQQRAPRRLKGEDSPPAPAPATPSPRDEPAPRAQGHEEEEEEVLPTVVQERHQPAPPPPPPSATGLGGLEDPLEEAATILERGHSTGREQDGELFGMSEAATLIRSNPLVDGDLADQETRIRAAPGVRDQPGVSDADRGLRAAAAGTKGEARIGLAQGMLVEEISSPRDPAIEKPPATSLPEPPRAPPSPAPPKASTPTPARPSPSLSSESLATPPTQGAPRQGSQAGWLMACVLFLSLGLVAGYLAGSRSVPHESPSAPPVIELRAPDGAVIEVDGEPHDGGHTLKLNPEEGQSVDLRVDLPGHPPIEFTAAARQGEHRVYMVTSPSAE